jgi:hypothetical protein
MPGDTTGALGISKRTLKPYINGMAIIVESSFPSIILILCLPFSYNLRVLLRTARTTALS